MKYKIFSLIISVSIFLSFLCGCGDTATLVAEENESSISETPYYVAEFYDNYGCNWMIVPGKRFDIKPNRVKEYAYNSNGTWGSSWATSSVISVLTASYWVLISGPFLIHVRLKSLSACAAHNSYMASCSRH